MTNTEILRELRRLEYLNSIYNPNYSRDKFILPNYSKRRERLIKMYYANKKRGEC